MPKLDLRFNEKPILFKEIENLFGETPKSSESIEAINWCVKNKTSDFGKYYETLGKRKNFNTRLIFENLVCDTISASNKLVKERDFCRMSESEVIQVGSYPLDYNFKSTNASYLIGMSVPPVMTANIANQIYLQWLSKI